MRNKRLVIYDVRLDNELEACFKEYSDAEQYVYNNSNLNKQLNLRIRKRVIKC